MVKAHGSGTALNDRVEEGARRPHCSRPAPALCSYKPLLGHAMAAAALAEMAGLLAGYDARAPARPPVTDEPAHPRLADGGRCPTASRCAVSVGLGGANTAAVLAIDR